MSEVLLPPWIIPEVETHEWLDEGSSVFPSAFAPGLTQRQSYGGLRLKLHRQHTVRLDEKAQLLSILAKTRGRFNAMRTKVHFQNRGSFAASELLTNNTFKNGTTDWSSNDTSQTDVKSSDRALRVYRVMGGSSTATVRSPSATAVDNAPCVGRAFFSGSNGSFDPLLLIRDVSSAEVFAQSSAISSPGLLRVATVPYDTDIQIGIKDNETAALAGDYADFTYTSLSRCALIDNGTNLLLQSDELDATWSASNASVDDQSVSAPDGTSTADSIIENSQNNSHYVEQSVAVSSSALDYSFGVALKAGARTWARLQLREGTGSTDLEAYFDLSNGVVGTATDGTNWSDIRTFVAPLGDDWYGCWIVGRKTSAATSLTARVIMATANEVANYQGDGTSNIYAWRATLAQSSVPTRLIQTTTTASTGTSQTGNALHVKGLEASEDGLLLPGDWFEINGELKQATAALNSDAAGLGYLQFEPALVRSPADNDPVIVTDPMGKFLVSNIKIDNDFGTQARVSYDLEHIYE